MADKESRETTVVIPLALTDFAKALRELIGAFRDAIGLGGDGLNLIRRHYAQGAATDLSGLYFHKDGFVAPLIRIHKGVSGKQDFLQIKERLAKTGLDISARSDKLQKYVTVVSEQLGYASGITLYDVISEGGDKFSIRKNLHALIRRWEADNDSDFSEDAGQLLSQIEDLNDKLIALHDQVFPPRGAPK